MKKLKKPIILMISLFTIASSAHAATYTVTCHGTAFGSYSSTVDSQYGVEAAASVCFAVGGEMVSVARTD